MQLSPQHVTVEELLQGKLFRIPDYQRAYSWGAKQRADLFHDIAEVARSDRDHFMATVVGLGGKARILGADRYKDVTLVDGQQRVTTLIILLKAIEKALNPDDNVEGEAKSQLRRLIVKADEHNLVLLQTNHDSSDVFSRYVREDVIEQKGAPTAADRNIIHAATECEKFVANWRQHSTLIELLGITKHRLSMIYHELHDEAAVYRVFEVLNSRGLDVKWLDKTKSQLMASIYEYVDVGSREDGLHEQKNIWKDIYRSLGLDERLGDEALKFAGTLKFGEKPNRILSEADASQSILQFGGNQIATLSEAGRWLRTVVKHVVQLHNRTRLAAVLRTQQARFLALAILLREFDEETERSLLGGWERLTFRIFTLAGKDSRSKVGDYVRLAYDIYDRSMSPDEILAGLHEIGKGFTINDVIDQDSWDGWYPDWPEDIRYVLYRYEEARSKAAGTVLNEAQWTKVWAADPSKSIEHIRPQSSGKGYVHDLGNLTLLPPGVNSSLKDKPPAQKAKRYTECGLEITMSVGREIIERGKWVKADVKRRNAELGEFIKSEWAG